MVHDSSEIKGFMMIQRVSKIANNTPVFIIGFLFLSWFALSSQPARFAGILFPVITPLNIESITEGQHNGLPATIIQGTITKLRNCDFKSMDWFIGGENNGTVLSAFLDPPQGRSKGVQHFSGILVGIQPDLFPTTFSKVSHSCSGITTISEFYTGDLSGL